MAEFQKVFARQVLDSRGFPTVEAEVHLASGIVGTAIVPSGASTGTFEALELRDKDPKRFHGKGVSKAVQNVNTVIAKALVGKSFQGIQDMDSAILSLDKSNNKSELGANAILAVSMAGAKALAQEQRQSFAEFIHSECLRLSYKTQMALPVPLMNVINGGAHADNGLDIQEFMIVPHNFENFSDALRAGSEIFHCLKKILSSKGLTTAVGDEGGFAPKLSSNKEALETLMLAISDAGYEPSKDVSLALDVAATEFYKDGKYCFNDPTLGTVGSEELISYYKQLCDEFPIVSIEDALDEEDWQGWQSLSNQLGSKVQLVGDDLYVTQVERLKKGIESKASNSILIKLNQVGSMLETLQTMKLAHETGLTNVVSHRSGETEDVSLVHLAVGTGAGQVKTGSLSRSDRVAKYNELLRLEEKLNLKMAQWSSLRN